MEGGRKSAAYGYLQEHPFFTPWRNAESGVIGLHSPSNNVFHRVMLASFTTVEAPTTTGADSCSFPDYKLDSVEEVAAWGVSPQSPLCISFHSSSQ